MNLPDRLRPKTFADVIGHAQVIETLQRLRDSVSLRGRGYWIDGPSGVGKSTIARLIAADVADDWGVEELDALALTPAKLREIDRQGSYRPLGRGVCYVVNEAQGLSAESVLQLLTMFDHVPHWVTWIFTTMSKGQKRLEGMENGKALIDRCTPLHLTVQGITRVEFAEYLHQIACESHLNGQPLKAYYGLLDRCHGSLRAALQAIEAGEMMGEKP